MVELERFSLSCNGGGSSAEQGFNLILKSLTGGAGLALLGLDYEFNSWV